MYKLTALLITALFMTGCAHDVANRYYVSEHYEAKNPSEVELLWRAPNRSYIVIADFQARGESPEDFRNKAAAIGADAIIVTTLGGDAKQDAWASTNTVSDTYTRIVGSAIKYKSSK